MVFPLPGKGNRRFQNTAQLFSGSAAILHFFRNTWTFPTQRISTHPHEGQQVFTQHIKRRYSTGDGPVITLPMVLCAA